MTSAVAVANVRRWNVAGEARQRVSTPAGGRRPAREVWANPILWREIRTRAYGRAIVVVRLAWLLLFAAAVAGVVQEARAPRPDRLAIAVAVSPAVATVCVPVTTSQQVAMIASKAAA